MIEIDNAVLERWESLADEGLLVSICHGPRKVEQGRIIWTVTVMHAESELESRVFEARDFPHCIEIAELEAAKLLRAATVLRRAGYPP